jgi:hypothetical protein
MSWMDISSHPDIFKYDYELIRKTNSMINEEIHQYVYHPRFIQKYIDEHGMEALDEF